MANHLNEVFKPETRGRKRAKSFLLHPVGITWLVLLLIVIGTLLVEGGDPKSLARLGTYYSQGDPAGTRGYDGQFVYYIALNPDPESVNVLLDAPAYRYQRILFPVLARVLAFGQPALVPWTLILLGIFSQVTGTWLLTLLLRIRGVSIWYALPYGLWVGFLLAVRLDLPEPLAIGLVLAGFLALERDKHALSWLFFGMAIFAKETTAVFVFAVLLSAFLERRWRDVAGMVLVAVLPFVVFQFWLWQTFGQFGLGSGGDMATPFEIIPFMGLVRIAFFSPVYFVSMLVVFGPAVILPAIWGIWISLRKLATGDRHVVGLSLLANSLIILFLPFSTYREPGGLLRFACGLIPVVILAASKYRQMRVLNYSFLWMVLNIFLLKS